MLTTAELEIRLSRPLEAADSTFEVRLRFQAASSAAWLESDPARIALNPEDFDDPILQENPDEYGLKLTAHLFADERVRTFSRRPTPQPRWSKARPCGVRLAIAPDSPGLHGLRWELLRDPWSGGPLVLGEPVWFSRRY